MTKIDKYPLICNYCDAHFEDYLYSTVNITFSPELLRTIYKGKLNVVECPQCHRKSYVDLQFLFHDQNDKDGLILVKLGEIRELYFYLLKKGYFDKFIKDKPRLFLLKFLRFTLKPFGYPKCKLERIKFEDIDWKKLLESIPKNKAKEKV